MAKKRQPKRRTSRASRPARSAAPAPHVLAAQLLDAYAGIEFEPDPMQVEMVASALAAPSLRGWWEHGADGHPYPTEAIIALLANVRERTATSAAATVIAALRAITGRDEIAALALADDTSTKLRFLGGVASEASRAISTGQATAACVQYDPWGEQVVLAIEWTYPATTAQPHVMVALYDSSMSTIKDLFLGPPMDEYRAEVTRLHASTEHADVVVQLEDIDLESARELLDEFLDDTGDERAAALDTDAFELLPLVIARNERMAMISSDASAEFDAHAARGRCLERHSEIDDLPEFEILQRFTSSAAYQHELTHGANAQSAEFIISFAYCEMPGGIAQFGPAAVTALVFDELPEWLQVEQAGSDPVALRSGLLPTMRAWTHFTHQLLGLAAPVRDVVIEVVERIAPELDHVFDPPFVDPHGGTSGFADRLLTEMIAQGVDPQDPSQLDAFMDSFNEQLSFAERGRILGLEE